MQKYTAYFFRNKSVKVADDRRINRAANNRGIMRVADNRGMKGVADNRWLNRDITSLFFAFLKILKAKCGQNAWLVSWHKWRIMEG